MITLDAGVLIAYLRPEDGHHAAAVEWLAANVLDEFGVSVVTLAEALVHPAEAGVVDTARRSLEKLGIMPVPAVAGEEARIARVRAETRLRMPDAIVVHTAEAVGGGLATTDARVARAAQARGIEAHLVG
ncbi:MAG: type II toxin-antitoxin system VapC family toxin [Microbacteriaceae bacterium]|nr:type II toxin-antitoxin system VapC family toxin [Microbacteriaceae bacterium]